MGGNRRAEPEVGDELSGEVSPAPAAPRVAPSVSSRPSHRPHPVDGPAAGANHAAAARVAARGSVGERTSRLPAGPSAGTARPAADASEWLGRAQFTLRLGAVDDPAEAEADRVADRVVSRIARRRGDSTDSNGTSGGISGGPEAPQVDGDAARSWAPAGPIRRVGRSTEPVVAGDVSSGIERVRSGGLPLPEPARRAMEFGFGADLSAVRVHTGRRVDNLNDRLNARAFTVGADVFFSGGVPDVSHRDGAHLMAHELAHTFQQGAVRRAPRVQRFGRAKTDEQFWSSLQSTIDTNGAAVLALVKEVFGVKGMRTIGPGKRSDDALAWRKEIKDAAREQAKTDVDAALDTYNPAADGNRQLLDTEKAFYRIKAKQEVHSTAKDSVKTVVTEAATEVYDTIWGGQHVAFLARSTYRRHLVMRPADTKGARAAAKQAVKDAFEKAKVDVVSAKRVVFGKEGAQQHGNDVQDAAQSMNAYGGASGLRSKARQQVQTDEVGQKAVKKTIEADSVEKGMGVLGTFLDNVVGSSGDQVSLAIEFRVPMEGYYLSFTLAGKAARGIDGAMTAGVPVFGNPRRLEVMGEFTFRVGTGIPNVVDVGGDIKLFTRGGANDTELCMKALSYGAYRRLGAISKVMANWWAGTQQGAEEGKALRAESWAAMIEEQVFKERADGKHGGGYVDVGGGIGVSAEVGSTSELIGGFAFGGGVSMFHSYNKESLEASLGDKFGTVVTDKDDAEDRRARVKGSYGGSYSFNGKVKFSVPGVGSVELAGSISGSINKPSSFGIEITGTLGYNGGSSSVVEKWAAGYATAVADLIKGFPKVVKPQFTDRVDAGVFTEAIAATTQAVNAGLENTVEKGLSQAWKVASGPAKDAAGLVTSSMLQVALIGGSDGEKPIFRLEIRSGRKLEINTPMAGAAGVKITGEKTSRLLAIGLDGGKVDAEIMGVRARGKTNMRGNKQHV